MVAQDERLQKAHSKRPNICQNITTHIHHTSGSMHKGMAFWNGNLANNEKAGSVAVAFYSKNNLLLKERF